MGAQSYQSIACNLLCSGLGVLVGEKMLSRNAAYTLSIIAALFPTLPIGLVGLGERPPTRYRLPARRQRLYAQA